MHKRYDFFNFRKVCRNFLSYQILILIMCSLLLAGCRPKNDTSIEESHNDTIGEKRVLMISSYSPAFRTFFQQINGVKSVFQKQPIQLDIEFMDTKRFYTDENFKLFQEYLTYKMSHVEPYDAIITSDDDAINFVMEHRQEMFAGIPIFFLAVNNYENAVKYSKEADVTGVFEAPSYHDTIRLAYDLNPNATRVVGLVDATTSGQGDLELFQAEKSKFPSLEFDTLDLSRITVDEFTTGLSSISENDIVLLISVYRDYEGTTYTFEEGLKLVLGPLKAPLYHTYEHGLGEGVLGGKVVSHVKQGESAAKQVLEYFRGTPISEIPLIDVSPNQYIIDWQVLKSYHLEEGKLPKEVKYINRTETFLEKYGKLITITLAIILLEGMMIAALFYLLQSSKKSRIELQLINEELESSLEDIKNRDTKIHDLIYIDTLTGLNNRFAIYEKIEEKLTKHDNEAFYIMFLDVDNFKNVNDLFGHDVGDALIRETGNQFKELLDEDIQVGRFGGDEFVFLISKNWEEKQIVAFVERISRIFKQSLKVNKQLFYLTISVGVSKYPEHGGTKEELIKKADIALYEAKKNGKDRYVIYDMHMDKILEEQLSFQEHLRSALNQNEFELYFQPLFRISDETILGFEALIRWHSEQLGWVSPSRLISVAEDTGLIIKLGEWIFEEAVKYARLINQSSERILTVAVNLSGIQLAYTGFYDFIMEIVRKYKVDPRWISLEITEAVFRKSIDAGNAVLQQLGAEGFGISLDDYGTGYTSLHFLKQFRIDLLKIDHSFINDFVQDAYDKNLVELVIGIAKQKSTYVVAEGVELKEQLELLRSMGCDIAQGFYLGKPVPAGEALRLSTEHKT